MTPIEMLNVYDQTGKLPPGIVLAIPDQEIEIKRTSTIFKRIKRKMDTVYLYLFGFNFRHMVGDKDLGLYWHPGILQDIGRVIRAIKYKFIFLVLDSIIFYCKIRGKDDNMKKWEKACLTIFLDSIEHKNN